jgi:hypothetical protein
MAAKNSGHHLGPNNCNALVSSEHRIRDYYYLAMPIAYRKENSYLTIGGKWSVSTIYYRTSQNATIGSYGIKHV